MMSRCSTWQTASLKERDEDEEYPWKTPIPMEEFEVESKPLPVGSIKPWQAAVVTKYDLMMIEFSRDETSWTKIQRSKHYSVLRILYVTTREVIKVTEALQLTYLAGAPLEWVPPQPIKPPALPTPRREKKQLIVEIVESIAIDKNRTNEVSSSRVDKTSNEVIETTRDEKVNETDPDAEVETSEERAKVPQKCDSKEHVEQATTEGPRRQQRPPQSSTSRQSHSSAEFTGTSAQRTVEQVIEVPVGAEERAQQRTVEQAVDVPTETAETEPATSTLDREQLDVTREVIRAKAAPRYESSLARGVRLELERCR